MAKMRAVDMTPTPNESTPSFPYPKQGSVTRKTGEGCTSCVHTCYCAAFLHLKKVDEVTPTNGVACASWSNKKEDRVEMKEQDFLYHQQLVERGLTINNYDEGFEGIDASWDTSIIPGEYQ